MVISILAKDLKSKHETNSQSAKLKNNIAMTQPVYKNTPFS